MYIFQNVWGTKTAKQIFYEHACPKREYEEYLTWFQHYMYQPKKQQQIIHLN